MANYKGVGFDDSKGIVRTGTASDTVDFAAEIRAQDALTVTGGTTTDQLSCSGNATISGNLNVTGDIISGGSQNVVIKDPAIDLGIGAAAAQSTGFAFVANQGTNSNTITSITAATRTIVCSGATSISANDIVQISGSSEAANDGLYVVASVSSPNIVLGNTAYGALPFIQTAFAANSTGGTVSQVDLKALIVAGEGKVNDSGGSAIAEGTLLEKFAADAVLSDFNSNGSYSEVGGITQTLQAAYNGGQTISTSGGNAVAITLANGNFEIKGNGAGAGNVDIGQTTVVNSIQMQADDTFSITTTAGSNDAKSVAISATNSGSGRADVTLTAQDRVDLTSSGATGRVRLDSAGTVDVLSDDSLTIQMDANSGSDKTLTVQSNNAGGGAANINIDADNDINLQVAASTIAGIDSSGLGVTGDIQASGNLAIFGNTDLGNANTDTLTITARIDSNVEPSTNNARDLGGASLVWANVYATAFTGSTLGLTSTATVGGLASLNGGIAVDGTKFTVADTSGNVSTEGTLNVDSTSTLGGDITLDKASGSAQTISKAASAQGDDLVLSLTGAQDASIKLQSAGTGIDAISLIASAGDVEIASEGSAKGVNVIGDFPKLVRPFTAGVTITAGQALYVVNDGGTADVQLADARDADDDKANFVGVALNGGNADSQINVCFHGIVATTSDTTFNAGNHLGKQVFLSATAGSVSPSAPDQSGDVVFMVGICVGGSGTSWQVLLQPQFRMIIG